MTLIGILILVLVIGIAMAILPVDPMAKRIVWAILALVFVLWLLAAFGLIGDIGFRSGPVYVR